MIVGGEPELALLLHLFPEGVEELDGAYAVYAEEPPIGFDVVAVDDVQGGWEDAWREFHHGVVIGSLWVGPPWEQPPPGAVAVVIDPGRAFGTGAHATTRLCLELLQDVEPTSLLDVGCGSGVLSVAAATERTPEPQPTSSRLVDSTSCRSSRQSRVVACAPVPNARPGSITTATTSAGGSSHGGPIQQRPTRTP